MTPDERQREADRIGMWIQEQDTETFLVPRNEQERKGFMAAFSEMLAENERLVREEGHRYCDHPDCTCWGPPHTHEKMTEQ